MTRAELNAIKARMFDEILEATEDGVNSIVEEMIDNQRYTIRILNMTMEDQTELLKKNGYMGA